MLIGVSGGLISTSFVRTELTTLSGPPRSDRNDTALIRLLWRAERELGPASGLRAIADVAALPLLELLGYRVASRHDGDGTCRLAMSSGSRAVTAVVAAWNASAERMRRDLLRSTIGGDARWCF